MKGEHGCLERVPDQPSQQLRQESKVSVPPPYGQVGNCNRLPVKGPVEAEMQPAPRNLI